MGKLIQETGTGSQSISRGMLGRNSSTTTQQMIMLLTTPQAVSLHVLLEFVLTRTGSFLANVPMALERETSSCAGCKQRRSFTAQNSLGLSSATSNKSFMSDAPWVYPCLRRTGVPLILRVLRVPARPFEHAAQLDHKWEKLPQVGSELVFSVG